MELRLGVAIYIIIMSVCVATSVIIYIKAAKTPALYSLMICYSMLFIWMFFAIQENMSKNAQETLFLSRIILFPISLIGAFWLIFALYYCGKMNGKGRLTVALILLPQIIMYLPALTNNYYFLIIAERLMDENGWTTRWGVLFYVNYAFTLIYTLLGTILIMAKSLSEYKYVKLRNILFCVSALIPLAMNIFTSSGVIKTYFDYVPVSFSICFLLMSIAIFRLKLIDVTPVAVNSIFGSLEEAILILDDKNSIVDYNNAAIHEFDSILDIRNIKNINVFLLLVGENSEDVQTINELQVVFQKNQFKSAENIFFSIDKKKNGLSTKVHYNLCVKLLYDNTGGCIGSIVSIRNVSELKRRTLDNERNRLSGDLHDTIGNCIMAISANLKYAIEMFSDSEEVLQCIRQAHNAATSGILYLRRIVEELTPLDIEKYGLVWALHSLFKKLETSGINIIFHYSGANEETVNKTKYSELIYKTCQEALNNSFYHGKAKEVFINLYFSPDELKLYITDDGVGCSNIIKSRGLTGMEERVRYAGGKVDFGSPSDGGFNIRISLPYGPGRQRAKTVKGRKEGSHAQSIDC